MVFIIISMNVNAKVCLNRQLVWSQLLVCVRALRHYLLSAQNESVFNFFFLSTTNCKNKLYDNYVRNVYVNNKRTSSLLKGSIGKTCIRNVNEYFTALKQTNYACAVHINETWCKNNYIQPLHFFRPDFF